MRIKSSLKSMFQVSRECVDVSAVMLSRGRAVAPAPSLR